MSAPLKDLDSVRLWTLLEQMQTTLSAGMTPHLSPAEADLLRPVLPEGWNPTPYTLPASIQEALNSGDGTYRP